MENKFIITKDGKHFKSDWQHHENIAKSNGISWNDVVECGMFLDKQLFILECCDMKHMQKKQDKCICGRLNFYQDMRLENWAKAREAESRHMYQYAGLREGD